MTPRSNPILVTGSHRSGSTWVGLMLACAHGVTYLHEPFNPQRRRGIRRGRFDNWYTCVCDENEADYAGHLVRCLQFKYNLGAELADIRCARDVARLVRDVMRFEHARLLRHRPLWKDPIALFSAEWLARRFAMDVIVLIRHPAAFAGSLKSAQWSHPFGHFLNQPLLMKYHLKDCRSQIEAAAQRELNIVDQAILLWNLTHRMILHYRETQPGWTFVRHEDISGRPVEEFRRLFAAVGLPFAPRVRRRIERYSAADGGSRGNARFRRDSRRNIASWKQRLTDTEIARIRNGTSDVARHFYSDAEWD